MAKYLGPAPDVVGEAVLSAPPREVRPPLVRRSPRMLRRGFAAAVLGLAVLGSGCGAGRDEQPGRRAADQRQLQAAATMPPAVSSSESLQVLDDFVAKF